MVEKALERAFKEIFQVKKVSFNQPGESGEQDCLFIEVEKTQYTFRDGREVAKVTGNAQMFGQNSEVTFGFFAKAIAKAKPTWTAPFFFYDFEENTKRQINLVQRALSFVYFFDSQYDPVTGKITSVNFTVEEH